MTKSAEMYQRRKPRFRVELTLLFEPLTGGWFTDFH